MNRDDKTLIILTPGFPVNEQDSTCIPSRQILVKALKENSSLTIIVLAFQYPFIKTKYKWHGIDVISFNGRNRGKLQRLRLWLSVWQTLKRIKKTNNVVGILSFWLTECALIGKYFAKRNDIKHYSWILGQDAKKGNKYFGLIKPNGSNLIALSDFISKEFFTNYAVKPHHIIPVGIDTSMFKKKSQQRDIDIMGAGSLIALKRYDLFIEVIKDLVIYFPSINVVICGAGPEKEKLVSQMIDHDLQKNIRFTGELPHEEVIALMQHSKIFFHTSSYEGFGTVHAEALYAGCHVVSFCKPTNEIFDHYNVVNNKKEAIDKLHELLNTELDHKSILTWSADNIAKKVIELFAG